MAFVRSQRLMIRPLPRALPREGSSHPLWGSSRIFPDFGSYVSRSKEGDPGCFSALSVCRGIRSVVTCSWKISSNVYGDNESEAAPLICLKKDIRITTLLTDARSMSTQARVPTQALRQGGLQVTMLSPGFVYEPYKPREPIPFWRRWFTLSGWRRTKEDMIMELKNAYAISQLRKATGYSKKQFYQEAVNMYKEINILLADGDKALLRKLVTENMFSAFKNELKRRESIWKSVYWEFVEPVIKVRTLRARMIGVDKNDLRKAFVQLTIEFLTKQKFEAYDTNGTVVAGDLTKEAPRMYGCSYIVNGKWT
uniref:Large ribosomal subunit protein mL45 n=1 Tax=Anthurium amnicola TaxID=1678845 RepID=A0A1D1YW47_9ARAE